MRIIGKITIALALFTAQAAYSLENRSVGNPIGQSKTPQSSVQSGLVRSQNPLDSSSYSSNDVVTGNVAGGKYFRGVVPYNSTFYFSGRTGTESLDSFLRYSGGSTGYQNYTGETTPFYSQSRSVTAITPQGKVYGPPMTYRSYREQSSENPQTVLPPSPLVTPPPQTYLPSVRPMSMSMEEIEKLISSQQALTAPQSQQKIETTVNPEQLEEILKQTGDRAAQLERKLEYKTPSAEQQQQNENVTNQNQPEQNQKQEDETSTFLKPQQPITPEKHSDVYERMKQQLLAQSQPKSAEPKDASAEKSKPEKSEKPTGKAESSKDLFENMPREELANKAETVRGKYKTFAAYSQDKFNRYMQAGENYLKEGKYYLAADAYTLAAVYKNDDPLAYAGRSHALFAAGEYMSSSLYLSRALTIFPDYAKFKIDLIGMIGDKDAVESRIKDINEWLTRSDSPELHFLLGYVYYQIDRIKEAKESINAASKQMPDAPAVKALKDAIYSAK